MSSKPITPVQGCVAVPMTAQVDCPHCKASLQVPVVMTVRLDTLAAIVTQAPPLLATTAKSPPAAKARDEAPPQAGGEDPGDAVDAADAADAQAKHEAAAMAEQIDADPAPRLGLGESAGSTSSFCSVAGTEDAAARWPRPQSVGCAAAELEGPVVVVGCGTQGQGQGGAHAPQAPTPC